MSNWNWLMLSPRATRVPISIPRKLGPRAGFSTLSPYSSAARGPTPDLLPTLLDFFSARVSSATFFLLTFSAFCPTGRDYIWGTGKVGVKCEGKSIKFFHFIYSFLLNFLRFFFFTNWIELNWIENGMETMKWQRLMCKVAILMLCDVTSSLKSEIILKMTFIHQLLNYQYNLTAFNLLYYIIPLCYWLISG